MTKQEFLDKSGETFLTEEHWQTIEFVYTWHPSIQDVKGKEQIATLYKIGGYRVIKDMFPTAKKCQELDARIRKAEEGLVELRKARMDIELGGSCETT